MMTTRAQVASLVSLVLACAASPAAAGQGVGFLAAVQGTVVVERSGAEIPGKVALEISMGDVIRTAVGARAKLLFGDGSVLNVGDDSRLRITRFVYDPKRDSIGLFDVLKGLIRAWVGKLRAHSRFEVRTDTAVAGVRGTDFVVRRTDQGTEVVVFSGEVRVLSPAPGLTGTCVAGPGSMCRVLRGKAPGKAAPTPKGLIRSLRKGTRMASTRRLDGTRLATWVLPRLHRLPALAAAVAAAEARREGGRDAGPAFSAERYRTRIVRSLPGEGGAPPDTVLPTGFLQLRVQTHLAGRY